MALVELKETDLPALVQEVKPRVEKVLRIQT
jgi:hypothetical protein